MGCKECGKPKCNGDCGCKSPKVLQINNPAEYITFHKVSIPAAMGDSTTNPPAVGKYKNVLLYYEADQTSWLYSSDGIPTKLTNGLTDYNEAVNLPQINGHTLIGDQSSSDLGLQGELTAGNGIELVGTEIRAKIGDGLEFSGNGEIGVSEAAPSGFFTDASKIVSGAGTSVYLNSTSDNVFERISLYGDLVQDGTPSPSSRVAIKSVTGDQQVTFSDGGQSSNVEIISLGELELYKIGSVSDSLYKKDGKWFVQRRIAKITLTGNESGYYRNGRAIKLKVKDMLAAGFPEPAYTYTQNLVTVAFCDFLVQAAPNDLYPSSGTVSGFGIRNNYRSQPNDGANAIYLYHPNGLDNLANTKTWLRTNLPSFYYVVASPTEVAIEDEKLIISLEKTLNSSSYASETDISVLGLSGNLPAKIEISAYKDTYAGEVSGLDDGVDRGIREATGSFLIDEIETNEYLDPDTNTHYWIVHIPHLDKDGNLIQIKHGLANDVENSQVSCSETTRDFAKRKGSTIAVNASIFGTVSANANYNHPVGTIIKDGKLISNYDKEGFGSNPVNILGVKEDNTLKVYPFGTSYTDLISDGVVNSFGAFDQVIVDGVITSSFSDYNYQWNLIGQNSSTKDIYLFVCNGKGIDGEQGMTLPNACQKLADAGCDFAYRLDQGGSTTLVKNSTVVNQVTDDIGKTIRKVPDFLYFGKEISSEKDKSILSSMNDASDASYMANIAEQSVRYLHAIESNEIILKVPSKVTNTTDARFVIKKKASTGEEYTDCSLVISPNDAPKTLNIWDNESSSTIVRIDGLNKRISLGGLALSTIFDQTQDGGSATDLDNLPFHTGVVRLNANYNLTNAPYTTKDTFFYYIIQLGLYDNGYNQRIQIAIPQIGRSELPDAIKIRSFMTSWSPWHYANDTQAVTTAKRPTKFLRDGMMIFDMTLGKPIWYNGGNWYDATGAQA